MCCSPAIPNTHIGSLEQVLAAAKLKPVSFALGISALQPPGAEKSDGVLALAIGESHVGLQITAAAAWWRCARSKARLKTRRTAARCCADVVTREARVTLGQLPAELRETVKRIRIFGPNELAQQLADEMELRFEPMGLKVEVVSAYAPDEFGVTLPPDASVSRGVQPGGAVFDGAAAGV